jgi:hypothetical protein
MIVKPIELLSPNALLLWAPRHVKENQGLRGLLFCQRPKVLLLEESPTERSRVLACSARSFIQSGELLEEVHVQKG